MRRILSFSVSIVLLGMVLQGCAVRYVESRGSYRKFNSGEVKSRCADLTLGIESIEPDEGTRKALALEEGFVKVLRESGCFKDVIYPCAPAQEPDLFVRASYSRSRQTFFLRNFWYTVFIPVAFVDGIYTHSVMSMSFYVSFPKSASAVEQTISRRAGVETADRSPLFIFSWPMYIAYHPIVMRGGGSIDQNVMVRQAAVVARQFMAALTDESKKIGEQVVALSDPSASIASPHIASATTTVVANGSVGIASRWAVVIGVSKYKDRRVPPLRYASDDARAFHQWLISAEGGYDPDKVKLLLDEEATYANMRHALYEWSQHAIAEDLITIYFAGHGSPATPAEPQNLFFLMYDTDYDKIASTAFPMWDIERAIKKFIRARKVIVVADACHAAGVGAGFDIDTRAIGISKVATGLNALGAARDGVVVLMASDNNQLSQEDERWGGGHGVFTHYLLEGLKGAADVNPKDRKVTISELAGYVSEQVRRATKSTQSPKIGGEFDPSLTLGQ